MNFLKIFIFLFITIVFSDFGYSQCVTASCFEPICGTDNSSPNFLDPPTGTTSNSSYLFSDECGHITLKVNFIVVSDDDGNYNFDPNNEGHNLYLDGISDYLSSQPLNLAIVEGCSNKQNLNINFDVERYYIDDSDYFDNTICHNNFCCPNRNNYFLNQLQVDLENREDIREGLNIYLTTQQNPLDYWYDGNISFIDNVPDPDQPGCETCYIDILSKHCSQRPTSNIDDWSMIHAPNMFLKYYYLENVNEHVEEGNAPFSESINWITSSVHKTFLHELGHSLDLTHNNLCDCNNFMSGANSSTDPGPCADFRYKRKMLTDDQIEICSKSISLKNIKKYVQCGESIEECSTIEEENHEIVGNNKPFKVIRDAKFYSDLIIENGTCIVMKGDIDIAADKKIIVKRGATLIIESNAILTSCEGQWKGIIVEGNSTYQELEKRYGLLTGFEPPYQAYPEDVNGMVILKPNAVIENAKTAVSTESNHLPYPDRLNYLGGIIYAEGAIFRNNKRAAEFSLYGEGSKEDISQFSECIFESNIDGVTIWRNNGVKFERNQFLNTVNTSILALNCHIFVSDNNYFLNNYIGIDIKNTFPVITHPDQTNYSNIIGQLGTTSNVFEACNYGIIMDSPQADLPTLIQNNVFVTGAEAINVAGIGNYDIDHNEFYSLALGAVKSTGTGFLEKNFTSNDVISSRDGIYSYMDNYGLSMTDNCFNNIFEADINVVEGDVFEFQGTDEFSAGNCFSKGNTDEIYATQVPNEFKYFIKSGTPVEDCNFVDEELGSFITRAAVDNNLNNVCGVNSVANEYWTASSTLCRKPINETELIEIIEELENFIAEIENNPNISSYVKNYLIKKYKRCLARLVGQVDSRTSSVTIANSYISSTDILEISILGLSNLLIQNDYNGARSFINNIVPESEEESDFKEVQQININYLESGRTYVASSTELNMLVSVANKLSPLSGYARSLYFLLTGERLSINFPEKFTPRNIKLDIEESILIYPNPSFGNNNVSISTNEIMSLTIYSIEGIPINKVDLNIGTTNISVGDLKSGVYFFHFMKSNNLYKIKKYIHI